MPILLLTNIWKFLTAVAVPLPYLPSTALLLSRPTDTSICCTWVTSSLEEELLITPLLSGVFMGLGVAVAVGLGVGVVAEAC